MPKKSQVNEYSDCVVFANLRWNICCKKRIENWTYPDLVMVIGSACLLIFFTRYIGPNWFGRTYVSSDCRVVINIWRYSPISFEHVSLRCLLFDRESLNFIPSVGVRLRKCWATNDPFTLAIMATLRSQCTCLWAVSFSRVLLAPKAWVMSVPLTFPCPLARNIFREDYVRVGSHVLLSDYSSKFQSSMTKFHQKFVRMQILLNFVSIIGIWMNWK